MGYNPWYWAEIGKLFYLSICTLMVPFERPFSMLSENHKIVEIGSTEFKLHVTYLLASFGIMFAGLPVGVASSNSLNKETGMLK